MNYLSDDITRIYNLPANDFIDYEIKDRSIGEFLNIGNDQKLGDYIIKTDFVRYYDSHTNKLISQTGEYSRLKSYVTKMTVILNKLKIKYGLEQIPDHFEIKHKDIIEHFNDDKLEEKIKSFLEMLDSLILHVPDTGMNEQ